MKKIEIVGKIKGAGNIFCSGMKCKKNIKRDILIISMVTLLAVAMIGIVKYGYLKKEWEQREIIAKADSLIKSQIDEEFESQMASDIKSIQRTIDTSAWKDYQTQWYGFKIKYPGDWNRPIAGVSTRGTDAEYKYSFRRNNIEDRKYAGFDVVVYSINKTKELKNTDEFPDLKSQDNANCESLSGYFETGDYAAEEVYASPNDRCYNSALFFSVVSGQYIYNIVPVVKDEIEATGDPMVEVSDDFPEFFSVISFFENIEIVRPKPKPVSVITAPKPVIYEKDSQGRRVCNKKNDNPGKSKQNKKKHMDMECCLDPDEYPNPWCYYNPEKYGKYLK